MNLFQAFLFQYIFKQATVDMSYPHLINVNEDPLLNGKVIYSMKETFTYVGKKNGNPIPQIILGKLFIFNLFFK